MLGISRASYRVIYPRSSHTLYSSNSSGVSVTILWPQYPHLRWYSQCPILALPKSGITSAQLWIYLCLWVLLSLFIYPRPFLPSLMAPAITHSVIAFMTFIIITFVAFHYPRSISCNIFSAYSLDVSAKRSLLVLASHTISAIFSFSSSLRFFRSGLKFASGLCLSHHRPCPEL